MEFSLDTIINSLQSFSLEAVAYISRPDVLLQLGLTVFLLLLSRPTATRLRRPLEDQARTIKGRPGLLRLIVIGFRLLHWAVFVVFLGLSIVTIQAIGWPPQYQILYSTALLALAWLVISFLSNVLRSRFAAQVIALIVWTYVALTILGISEDVADLLDSAGFTVGSARVSALLLLRSFIFLGATLWLAIAVGNSIEKRIQRSEELNPSMRVLIGKILKISLIFTAFLAGVSAIGIDLTVFAVFSGAIGVGIGFGLQKVVSNFISGIIILADRSIKPGDTISLGDTFGWIRGLRARFVSVVTRDGKEYLIPNEDFITQQVINWSFSDDFVRLDVNFGVSYRSDPHKVIELSVTAANGLNRIVPVPTPVCWMTGFGDSSLDFILRFWIRDPQNGLTNIRGQMLLALWDIFKENDIKIPYPHREVYIHSESP
ncbi:MAG: mechanosensitive ion channel [Gammaproteobacteria bacterium]|nr:mechanosensitive ion channel [Gammaproteobacteria bacterium]